MKKWLEKLKVFTKNISKNSLKNIKNEFKKYIWKMTWNVYERVLKMNNLLSYKIVKKLNEQIFQFKFWILNLKLWYKTPNML